MPDLVFMLEPRYKALLVLSFGMVKHGCPCFSMRLPGKWAGGAGRVLPLLSSSLLPQLMGDSEDWEESTSASFLEIYFSPNSLLCLLLKTRFLMTFNCFVSALKLLIKR